MSGALLAGVSFLLGVLAARLHSRWSLRRWWSRLERERDATRERAQVCGGKIAGWMEAPSCTRCGTIYGREHLGAVCTRSLS